MSPNEIKETCQSFPSATFDLKIEWEAELGRVADKIFAMLGTDNNDTPILTVKALPDTCTDLKLQYPDWIRNGYYMNKRHWVSIEINHPECDSSLCKELLKDSYDLIAKSLPKKIQATL